MREIKLKQNVIKKGPYLLNQKETLKLIKFLFMKPIDI